MGRVIPFRRRRKGDFGRVLPTRQWRGTRRRGRLGRWLVALRPFLLLAILLIVWAGYDPALVEPPGFLSGPPERVAGSFTRCGPGRGTFCVIDGDTFKLGERKVRLIGIDAPETHPARCPAEALAGEAATAELQRLLNQGPFIMTGRIDDAKDRYGRDLRSVTRRLSEGSVQSVGADMLASDTVRRYAGGLRGGWC